METLHNRVNFYHKHVNIIISDILQIMEVSLWLTDSDSKIHAVL